MVFLSINSKNYNIKDKNGKTPIDQLNSLLHNDNNNVFILFYMDGCGPCNATRPEWEKLKNVLKHTKNKNDVVIVDIDHVLSDKLTGVKEPSAFPTMRYITNGGKTTENYEDSSIDNKERTIDSFVEWINSKTNKNDFKKGGKKTIKRLNKPKSKKWSNKYKRSIHCNKPRGFSQKQYCKYGRSKKRH